MMTNDELKELQSKFLKTSTDYHNDLLNKSKREKTFNYVVVNSETYEKLKKIGIEIKE